MIEVDKPETNVFIRILYGLVRILCLLLPIGFAFGGYYLSSYIWHIFNNTAQVTQLFRFICSIVFFLVPTLVIFICTRKLNPVIKITITNKKPSKKEGSVKSK